MENYSIMYIACAVFIVLVVVVWFYHHQCLLRDRAHLMREAVRNGDFTFHLPGKGLFFGERALQEALNDLGQDINKLVAKNEVESWQRLTRVLTHEIMNATTPIQSISQAYLGNPKIQGTIYEEGIRAIHDTSMSLGVFVDSYRKLTALQELELADVDLLGLAESVRLLYPELTWHIDIPVATTIYADENFLRQVLINIAKNAIEADARTVDIRWRDALLISNDGQPIPADVRRDIFVPFFTTKHNGSGIGLSLSRQVLMRQGIILYLADTPVSGYHVTFGVKPPSPQGGVPNGKYGCVT